MAQSWRDTPCTSPAGAAKWNWAGMHGPREKRWPTQYNGSGTTDTWNDLRWTRAILPVVIPELPALRAESGIHFAVAASDNGFRVPPPMKPALAPE
jgi:hypothetical protein